MSDKWSLQDSSGHDQSSEGGLHVKEKPSFQVGTAAGVEQTDCSCVGLSAFIIINISHKKEQKKFK